MRIAHLVNASAEGIVGVERKVLYLAAAQKARGASVTVVTDHRGVLTEACDRQGMSVVVMPSLARAGMQLQPAADVIRELMSQFGNLAVELIHCHTLPVASQAIPAGNQLNISCVLTFNGPDLVLAARKAGLRFATILVIRSRYDELRNSGMPEQDIFYVPNGTKSMPRAALPGMVQPVRPNLIFVGSLIPRKGVDVAVHAVAELRHRLGPDCPALNIYGDGEQAAYLAEMVAVLRLGEIIRFHGFQEDILERCSASDILVMSSRSETGPQVVLEAMSRGMPIVASEVGEVAEMLPDRRYGRIVPVESIVPLADAIESLLAEVTAGQFDPGPLIERHRSLYSDDRMAERIEAIYQQILLDRSPAA